MEWRTNLSLDMCDRVISSQQKHPLCHTDFSFPKRKETSLCPLSGTTARPLYGRHCLHFLILYILLCRALAISRRSPFSEVQGPGNFPNTTLQNDMVLLTMSYSGFVSKLSHVITSCCDKVITVVRESNPRFHLCVLNKSADRCPILLLQHLPIPNRWLHQGLHFLLVSNGSIQFKANYE